jgi:DNA-binding transcriptional LysR family regulator
MSKSRLCECSRAEKAGMHMAFHGKLLSGVSVLMAVVEAGTIARAAEALGLSPSGVSRALARLEQRVGARLLARTTRSLSLTDEGRRFYEQVGPHMAGIEEAAIEAAGSASKVRGRLRVNAPGSFCRTHHARLPEQLQFSCVGRRRVVAAFDGGQLTPERSVPTVAILVTTVESMIQGSDRRAGGLTWFENLVEGTPGHQFLRV